LNLPGCELQQANRLHKRLRDEGYLSLQSETIESQVQDMSLRRKALEQIQSRKKVLAVNLQYEQRRLKKQRYFTPGGGVEDEITVLFPKPESRRTVSPASVASGGSVGAFARSFSRPDWTQAARLAEITPPAATTPRRAEPAISANQLAAARQQNAARERRAQRASGLPASSPLSDPLDSLTNSPEGATKPVCRCCIAQCRY
jgi:hypothetical protein